MFNKKLIIPIIIFSFLFTGLISINNQVSAAEQNLYWGSKGSAVVQLQKTLNNNNYWCGTADGIFGSKTYNAVIKFQKDVGITVDGIVGPQTRKYLGLSASTENYTPVSRGARTITMVATGYSDDPSCNWPWVGYPSYMGDPLKRGIVAVDPNVIPMGSNLYIEGYGYGKASDQGGAIKGNRIDLCFDSYQEALNWGIKTVKVTLY